jgi:hypothetical protein
MKMIKMALLGGAALAVTTAAARADDLSALKAQIESLNARVAQMEAAPAVPAGYSLLTVSEGDATVVPGLNDIDTKETINYGKKATIISVLPTADAPAATTIEWSGYARAALVYTDGYRIDDEQSFDVMGRGQLKVVGKTDTAVGEVGARIQMRANINPNPGRDTNPGVVMNEFWGWWAMTPELTLGGGYTGSLGNIGYGYDGACNCYYTDNADVGMNPGDAVQMRLSWASGPFSMGVAVEDDSRDPDPKDFNLLAAAGEIKYTGDMFNGEISGYAGGDDRFRVGAGLGFALGDIASISMGAQYGDKGHDNKFWTASILGSMNLSDEVHAEAAFGHTAYDDADYDVNAALVGIYYDPVSQLTIGLEGEWIDDESEPDAEFIADLVTVFRF